MYIYLGALPDLYVIGICCILNTSRLLSIYLSLCKKSVNRSEKNKLKEEREAGLFNKLLLLSLPPSVVYYQNLLGTLGKSFIFIFCISLKLNHLLKSQEKWQIEMNKSSYI